MSKDKRKVIDITKYSHNRTMYDATNRKPINLTKMANHIKNGFDLNVNLDQKYDITTEMLLSILLNTGLDFKKEKEVVDTLYYLIEEHLKVPKK